VYKSVIQKLQLVKLALNINKTNTIKFDPEQSFNSLAFTSGNLFMNEVPVIKFLGLQIDRSLDWKSHVEYILPKLSSAIFLIRSLSYFISKNFFTNGVFFLFPLYS
jgi:hypothetical protein